MGLNTLRSLSVLLILGVALVGCNNTDKDKKLIGANKGAPPFSTGQVNTQGPTFPSKQPFPTNPSPGLGAQPGPVFPATTGNVTPASPNFTPPGGLTPLGGSASPTPGPGLPSNSNSFAPSMPPPNAGGFGSLRSTAPTLPAASDGFGNNGPSIMPPPNFNK